MPFNENELRSVFLKYNNEFEGKYFADLIKVKNSLQELIKTNDLNV